MSARSLPPWQVGLLIVLLLCAPACRPLLTTPPGCEDRDPEVCAPQAPAESAAVHLRAPAELTVPSDPAPIFGRFVAFELEVERPSQASEVELLCGSRRLATWWVPQVEEESLTLRAVVDLLPCRAPGANAHPHPVELSLVLEDPIGGVHDFGRYPLRLDLTAEEGPVEVPGDPTAPPLAEVEVETGAAGPAGTPAVLRVNMALAQAPEIRVRGTLVPASPSPRGWAFLLPPLDLDPADIDTLEVDVEVQAHLRSAFGINSVHRQTVTLSRALRELVLEGDLFSPWLAKPGAWPVMTDGGLVMVLEASAPNDPTPSARLARIPLAPDATPQEVRFGLDPSSTIGHCSLPGVTDPEGHCVLGMNGRGQLVVRKPQAGSADFLVATLRPDAWDRWQESSTLEELLQEGSSDPAVYSQPQGWARLGEERLCTEARTVNCTQFICDSLFDRACVLADGTVELTEPVTRLGAPGSASRALGGASSFITYDHLQPPTGLVQMTYGTDLIGQVPWFSLSHGIPWGFQPGLNAILPLRDGLALISQDGSSSFLPDANALLEQPYWNAWQGGTAGSAIPVHVEPDGAVIVLRHGTFGELTVARWRPGAAAAEQSTVLPLPPEGFQPVPRNSMDLLERGYSQTLPDGKLALVYQFDAFWTRYQLLILDRDLTPLFRRTSERPLRVVASPDATTQWLLEAETRGGRWTTRVRVLSL